MQSVSAWTPGCHHLVSLVIQTPYNLSRFGCSENRMVFEISVLPALTLLWLVSDPINYNQLTMDAFKGKYERTSADQYEEFLKVCIGVNCLHFNVKLRHTIIVLWNFVDSSSDELYSARLWTWASCCGRRPRCPRRRWTSRRTPAPGPSRPPPPSRPWSSSLRWERVRS